MTTTETDRLRAENERLTRELQETRMQAISDFGQYQDSFDAIERLTKERDEALKNFNIVWDDREVARMQLADAVARAQAAEAALAELRTLDFLGRALELEEQAKRVSSQTVERAMLGAAVVLRNALRALVKGEAQ